jgi:deazaflavin-dependent oxidoreductase (nitroreductase family)
MSNVNDWNQQVIEEFRANGGKVGGPFANMALLLLHTTGARSGEPRINPVAYITDGGRYVIVASKGGAPTNPDWFHNLAANPRVGVEVGTEQFEAEAVVTTEPERTELYRKVAALYPNFADYEQRTERAIPVVTLTRLP